MFLLHPDAFLCDLGILLLVAFGASVTVASWVWMRQTESGSVLKAIVGFVGLISFLGFLLTVYGSFIEPRIIVTTHATVTQRLSGGLKIAVVSDLHVGPYTDAAFVRSVVERVNTELPDMVLMPGDFIFGSESNLEDFKPLKALRAPLGVFAVLGNHDVGRYETPFGRRYSGKDRGDAVTKALAENGVRVLRNDHEVIPLPDGAVTVAGIDDLWTGHADIRKSLTGIPSGSLTILLSHNPSVILETEASAAHLIVSGHTHGGQFRLPFIGPLTRLPTALGNSFDQGIFPLENNRTLAISRGIGESGARARLFAWPEVMVVDVENE